MKTSRKTLIGLAIGLTITACYSWYNNTHMSETEITDTLRTSMQAQFSTGDYQPDHLSVGQILLVHDQGGHYRADARVTMDAQEHEVQLTVLVDGNKLDWHTEPGALAFVAEKHVREAQAQAAQAEAQAEAQAAQETREELQQLQQMQQQALQANQQAAAQ